MGSLDKFQHFLEVEIYQNPVAEMGWFYIPTTSWGTGCFIEFRLFWIFYNGRAGHPWKGLSRWPVCMEGCQKFCTQGESAHEGERENNLFLGSLQFTIHFQLFCWLKMRKRLASCRTNLTSFRIKWNHSLFCSLYSSCYFAILCYYLSSSIFSFDIFVSEQQSAIRKQCCYYVF